MATPTTTIDALPLQTVVTGTQLIVIQETGVTKKSPVDSIVDYIEDHIVVTMTADEVSALLNPNIAGTTVQAQLTDLIARSMSSDAGLAAHLADPTDAHDASAISATTSGPGIDAADVQGQLAQLSTALGIKDVVWVGPDAPTDPVVEMWWDENEPSAYLPAGVEYATDVETIAGTLANKAVSPASLKVATNSVDVRAGGVIGDGAVDDGAALNAFLTANAGRVVIIPQGFNVRTTVPIFVPSKTTLRAYGAKLTNACPGVNDRLLRVLNVTDVIVEGLELDGVKAAFAAVTEFRHNIMVEGSTRVTLRDIYSHDPKGDGIWVGTDAAASVDVVLDNCTFDTSHRNGCSIISANGFKATNCQFINSNGTSPMAGVDIEPNAVTTVCENITFTNCTITGNNWDGFAVVFQSAPTAAQRGVTVIGCEISGQLDATNGNGVHLRWPNDVKLIGCSISRNAANGVWLQDASTLPGPVLIDACSIADNQLRGIYQNNVPNVVVSGCSITGNSTRTPNSADGIDMQPTVVTAGFRIVSCRFDGVTQRYGVRTGVNMQQVTLVGNRYGTMGTGAVTLADDPITRYRAEYGELYLTHATAGTNVIRVHNGTEAQDRIVVRSDGEIRIGDGIVAPDVRLYRSAAATARMTNAFQVDQAMTMKAALDHDGTLVGFYNTTPIVKPAATGSRAGNVALASLLTQLAALGLITDSSTA